MPAGGWTGNGQSYGWTTHQGVDYGTPAGSAITAPFGGTVTYQTGLLGYGNKITLTLANGWKIIFGHVASGVSGAVQAGQKIGVTGQNVGSSQGAVTLVEVHNASGKAVNPHTIMDPIFAGTASITSLFGAASASLMSAPGTDPCAGLSGLALIECRLGAAAGAVPGAAGSAAGGAAGSAAAADPFGIASAIRSLLPTSTHIYRAFFVGLGILMVGVGALIYFKGDELRTDISQAGKDVAKAGVVAA